MRLPITRPSDAERTATIPRTWAILLIAIFLTAAVAFGVTRTHSLPSFRSFGASLGKISITQLALGILAINGGLIIRAVRWALLMPGNNRPPAARLIAPQFVGFTAVSLFGRVADLTRPYLVARRTSTPVAMQVAVYSVERALDLAATAVLFSVTLLFVPKAAPHHQAFTRSGILATAATLCVLLFALVVRAWGAQLASVLERRVHPFAPKLANALAGRVLEMQTGFANVRSGALALAFLWSLVIWIGIAAAYLFSTHSLPATPQLTQLGPRSHHAAHGHQHGRLAPATPDRWLVHADCSPRRGVPRLLRRSARGGLAVRCSYLRSQHPQRRAARPGPRALERAVASRGSAGRRGTTGLAHSTC